MGILIIGSSCFARFIRPALLDESWMWEWSHSWCLPLSWIALFINYAIMKVVWLIHESGVIEVLAFWTYESGSDFTDNAYQTNHIFVYDKSESYLIDIPPYLKGQLFDCLLHQLCTFMWKWKWRYWYEATILNSKCMTNHMPVSESAHSIVLSYWWCSLSKVAAVSTHPYLKMKVMI